MKDELRFVFDNINEWLKFAEAKHAGLIVLNIAIAFGILSFRSGDKCSIDVPSASIVVILSISSLISLYSFLPKLKAISNYPRLTHDEFQNKKQYLNCYYFGSISKLSDDQYLELMKSKLGLSSSQNSTSEERDLAKQILINSEVTSIKYMLFNRACYCTVVAIGLGTTFLIISLF